jgi:hypothetical protein
MVIKRGILQAFNATNYTASVLFFEATSYALAGIPVANHIDGTSGLVGAICAVLFFDEHNPQDAVIIATFGSVPTPAPGRVTFLNGYSQLSASVIAASSINTYTLTGGASGIPAGALGVLYKAYFTSATAGSYILLAPHGAADISAYAAIGNLPAVNAFLDGCGLLAVDGQGRIDIKANGGACTVTLYTYGYVI